MRNWIKNVVFVSVGIAAIACGGTAGDELGDGLGDSEQTEAAEQPLSMVAKPQFSLVERYWGGPSIQPLEGDEQPSYLFAANLPLSPPATASLRNYQTPIKSQTQGECVTQAFLGGVEAFYKRNCMNKVSGFATAAYCGKQNLTWGHEELDLSEQYLIHSAFTRWAHHGTSSSHENGPSLTDGNGVTHYCWTGSYPEPKDVREGGISGLVDTIAEGVRLPLEKDAPQFGSNLPRPGHAGQTFFTMAHLDELRAETGMAPSMGCFNQSTYQRAFDDYQFDPDHIPRAADDATAYGATEGVILPYGSARNTSLLEKYIANGYEVVMGLDLSGLGCDNRAESHCTWNLSVPNPPNMGVGHAMLAIAYDRNAKEILMKNSWGPASNAWMWVPYDFVAAQANWGLVITNVRVPQVDKESKLMGAWNVWNNGSLEGRLVIHRTRASADHAYGDPVAFSEVSEAASLRSKSRWGTFYPYSASTGTFGHGKRVVGELSSSGTASLYLGSTVYEAGDSLTTNYNTMQLVVWGPATIDAAGKLHISSSREGRRDFSLRAAANWEGTWSVDVATANGFANTLTITNVDPIMNSDGTYTASGTYQTANSTRSITGKIDGDGHHGVFDLSERRCSGGGWICGSGGFCYYRAGLCLTSNFKLDATSVRFQEGGTLKNELDTASTVYRDYPIAGSVTPAKGTKTN